MWTAWAFPLVILAIVVATGPVIVMTYHSIRFGHHPSPPERASQTASRVLVPATPTSVDPEHFGWTVCPHCKAVVVDPEHHAHVLHASANS
jgi:hypothetical protein